MNRSRCQDCDSDCPGPSDDCHCPCHLPENESDYNMGRESHESSSPLSDSDNAAARISHENIPPWQVPGEGVTDFQSLFAPSSFCILRRSNGIDDNLPANVSAPAVVPFSYVRTAILEDGVLPCVINGHLCQMRHVPPHICDDCTTDPYHDDDCRCSCHHPDVVIDGCWGFGNCEAGCGPPLCMCPCHFLFPWQRFFESDEDEDEDEE